jgi:hypothetical protein
LIFEKIKLLLERKKNFVKMKERERERERKDGEVGETLETLDVLETRERVLE